MKTFLPLNANGEYLWVNIFTLIFVSFLALFSTSSLVSYLILEVILKKEDSKGLKIICLRWGLLFTLGIFIVILLNFFHILNVYWGLGILLVVIIASFVI